jgi:hypothetical protein
MEPTLANLLSLARLSITAPREAARAIMALRMPMNARWAALVLMAVCSALVMHLMAVLMPSYTADGLPAELIGPFVWAGTVSFGMIITALLVHYVGRWRGGTGRFADALILVTWLQFIQLLLVIVQLVLMLVIPPLVPVFEILTIVIFLWLLTNFVAEVHGFKSHWMVFGSVIATFLVAVFLLSLLLLPFLSVGM